MYNVHVLSTNLPVEVIDLNSSISTISIGNRQSINELIDGMKVLETYVESSKRYLHVHVRLH